MARLATKRDISIPVYLIVFFMCVALSIHAYYVSTQNKVLPRAQKFDKTALQASDLLVNSTPRVPPLFIYRRTKKSGSSAMLDALIHALKPYGYVPLYVSGAAIKVVVRAESVSSFPRRLLIAEHNQITRQDDPFRRAVIADTVRDGYEQVTSFCRYQRNVKMCDHALIDCLKSEEAKSQNRYRWAGREREDADTYIDLPLSAAHPALSTTILQRVYPNVTLDIYAWNSENSKCPELPMLREVYSRFYGQLDRQVQVLRQRMLILAGYPFRDDTDFSTRKDDGNKERHVSLEEMLSVAEAKERAKYDINNHGRRRHGFSKAHKELISSIMRWSRDKNNSIILTPRWK